MEEAQKSHARKGDGDAAIIEDLSSVFCGSFAWLSWQLADRAGNKIGLATAMIFFEAPQQGYAVLYDLLQNSSRERGCCPGRHSLRFTIYRLGGGCR